MPIPLVIAAGAAAGALMERYGVGPNYRNLPEYFSGNFDATVETAAMNRAQDILIDEEGKRNDVYLDGQGNPTVGIGHKVLPSDNLRLGQFIDDQRVYDLFAMDIEPAFNAAVDQANEINKYTVEMIARLTSVNFQLGTKWKIKFPNTWAYIRNGDIGKAIKNLSKSAWADQTPDRVTAFADTLRSEFMVG